MSSLGRAVSEASHDENGPASEMSNEVWKLSKELSAVAESSTSIMNFFKTKPITVDEKQLPAQIDKCSANLFNLWAVRVR